MKEKALEGNDFADRIVESLMRKMAFPVEKGGAATLGKVAPGGIPVFFKEKVIIHFSSKETVGIWPRYEGKIVIKPAEFGKRWLLHNAGNLRATGSVDIEGKVWSMGFGDGSVLIGEDVFELSFSYIKPTPDAKSPSQADLERTRESLIQEMLGWFEE